jgi:hypothetical protein
VQPSSGDGDHSLKKLVSKDGEKGEEGEEGEEEQEEG